ncbi:MAG: hypothetical protein JRH11_07105 [Deltaproteobacteria bacterium]|nr:hypothetical protein [Deltaproteobacteria bacterium]
MRFVTTLSVFLFVALGPLAGCGGGTSSSAPEATPAAAPVAAADEASGPAGSAQSGQDCDFGGADRTTCGTGLICCYPEEGEVAYGTCVASCPGYD